MMQRHRQDTGRETRNPKLAEPMEEGALRERRPNGMLAGMSDAELIGYAEWIISSLGICRRAQLAEADSGLYHSIHERGLLDSIGLEDARGDIRDWAGMSDGELVAFAKGFVAEKGIKNRNGMDKADCGLVGVLRRRGLLEEVGLRNTNEGNRDWAAMGDEELKGLAKALIAGRGIEGRMRLQEADSGLYQALRRRRLLGDAGIRLLRREPRSWAAMSDGELKALARNFIEMKGIGGRQELVNADSGLHHALVKRKLLDAVFSDTESSRQSEAVLGVIGALESFGDGK